MRWAPAGVKQISSPLPGTLSVNLADIAVYYAFNTLVSFIDFVALFADDTITVWVDSEEDFVDWLTAFRLLLKDCFGLEITF